MTNPNYSFGLIKDMPNVKIEQKLILALRCPPEKILVWFIWKKNAERLHTNSKETVFLQIDRELKNPKFLS